MNVSTRAFIKQSRSNLEDPMHNHVSNNMIVVMYNWLYSSIIRSFSI